MQAERKAWSFVSKMKEKYIYNIIKITGFLSLLLCMFSGVLRVLNYKDMGGGGGWQRFYQEESNSIDVMFFGNSHAHCTIDHGILWDEYGIAGYTLSAGSQEIDSTCYFVKEALRTQHPAVIVVEVMGALGGELANSDYSVNKNSLGMRWSPVFGEYIAYLADNMDMDRGEKQRAFLKVPIVHSRYAELTQSDFEDPIPFMRGYRGSYEAMSVERPEAAKATESMELNPQRLAMLKEIIETAKQNHIPVVLFAAPFKVSEENQMQFNAIEAFAKEQDIPFINYNKLYDEISLDFETDFREESHVNNGGAAKVTQHMAQYLAENYALPDRRGQEGYRIWEDNALYLRNKTLRYQLETAADINAYLQILSELEEEQTVIITLTGNYNALGEVYLEKLMQLGITAEEYAEGGAFLLKGGERICYLAGQEYHYCYNTGNGEIHIESALYGAGDGMGNEMHILMGENDYAMVENGVNVLVYNEEINQLIDAAGDDVYQGLELIHCDMEEE